MGKYTISTSEEEEAALTAVRQKANDAMPETVKDGEGEDAKDIPNPDLYPDNASYFKARMGDVLDSYVRENGGRKTTAEILADVPADKRAAVEAVLTG